MSHDVSYVILETEHGLTVAELMPTQSLDDVAVEHDGLIVDGLTYRSFDDAYDALLNIQRAETSREVADGRGG